MYMLLLGSPDDHECVTEEELLQRLRVGMSVLVREGSTERNLDALIGGVLREKLPLDNLMFCTDDKHAGEINRRATLTIMLPGPWNWVWEK